LRRKRVVLSVVILWKFLFKMIMVMDGRNAYTRLEQSSPDLVRVEPRVKRSCRTLILTGGRTKRTA
jgi:hypothetical protein